MPTIPSRDRTEIIDEIRRYAQDRLPPEQQRLFLTFVGQYYGRVARGDLAARPVHDLYGAAMSHLTLASTDRRVNPRCGSTPRTSRSTASGRRTPSSTS